MVLEDVLMAIYPRNGNVPVGAGFRVERDLVLTCAHVVNEALGRPQTEVQRPSTDAKVRVKQHAPAASAIAASVDAADDAWNPPPVTRQPGADLCLLRLEVKLADDFMPMQLRDLSSDGLPIYEYRALGFPRNWDVDVSLGQIQARDSNGLYILRPDSTTSAVVKKFTKSGFLHGGGRTPGIIAPGFSGGPVEVKGTVVGLIAEVRSPAADATAYMIPVSVFPRRLTKDWLRSSIPTDRLRRQLLQDRMRKLTDKSPRSPVPADGRSYYYFYVSPDKIERFGERVDPATSLEATAESIIPFAHEKGRNEEYKRLCRKLSYLLYRLTPDDRVQHLNESRSVGDIKAGLGFVKVGLESVP